jgi:phospholipase/lecithinase/hemolysin/tetratricopeptide (TPR) repeat protein
MTRSLAALGLLLVIAPQEARADGSTFNQIFVFGDSLSDTGNLNSRTGNKYLVPPKYTTGRFTDGASTTPPSQNNLYNAGGTDNVIWHEQLAKMVGLPVASPSLLAGNQQNYAFGGATTGAGTTVVFQRTVYGQTATLEADNMGQQVTSFLANVKNNAPANGLYILWGGGNDLRNVFFPANAALNGLNNLTQITKAKVVQAADTAAQNIQNEITTLSGKGAKQFLWPDLPPLNLTPKFLAVDKMKVGDGTLIGDDLAAAVSQFNNDEQTAIKALQKQLPNVKIVMLDDYTAVNTIITNVQKNGQFDGYTNVTAPAQGMKVDPDTYLFWDEFHPTVHAEYDLAKLAQQSLMAAGLSTPEPSSYVMMISGVALVALGRWWSRRPGTWTWAYGVWIAVVTALAGVPTSRAGSIVLTAEWLEQNRSAPAGNQTSSGPGDLDLASRSFEAGDFDACLKQVGQAVQAHPELPPAQVLFAKLAFQNHQMPLIRPALERAVAEAPEHPEAFLLFGDLAVREGRLTDAAVHFEKARALASSGRWTAAQRREFDRLALQGHATVAEGRADSKAAKAALEGWLELEPASAQAHHRLGKALFSLGQHDAAYQELQRAVRQDGTLEPAAITMGLLYTLAGDGKKAQEWMDYAVQVAPDSPAVHIGRGIWLLGQGRTAEAQDQAAAAEKLDPQSSAARRLLGLAARARKDFACAEPIFRALAQQAPGDAWVRHQLALVLAEQPDEAKRRQALELAEQATRQHPNDPEALATLGTVCYRLHRLDQAEQALQAVVDSGQGSSDAAYILARVKVERGRAGEAPPLLKAALAAPGFFAFRDEARQWLDRLALASPAAPHR